MRRTEQALLETMNRAQSSLLIVSFAIYLLPSITNAVLIFHTALRWTYCLESSTEGSRREPL